MSETDLTFAELVAANPIPLDAVPHHLALTEGAILDVIETWSASPDLPTAAPVSAPMRRQRRGWLTASAAFVAVLLLVGVVAAITSTGGGNVVEPISTSTLPTTPPATQAPPSTSQIPTTSMPTTTSAPGTTAALVVPTEVQSAIDEFVATFNAGDPSATIAALSPTAEVWTSLIAGTFTSEDPLLIAEFEPVIERWLRYLSVQQAEMVINTCGPIDGGRVNCRGTFSDEIVEASPLSPASLLVTFAVNEDGVVTYFFVRENEPAMNAAYDYFGFWLNQTYPGEDEILYDGTGRPRFLDEALALWEIRVAEWIESLEG